MALDLNQIKQILQKPTKRQVIQKAANMQKRLRFHTETNIAVSDINQPTALFLDWVRNLLPKDKYNIFLQLFKFPLSTPAVVEDVYRELERVFYSRNSSSSYQFTDSELAEDWADYRKNKLNEPDIWKTVGWKKMQVSINSILVVDLPQVQMSARPEPYFYWLEIEDVVDYEMVNDTEFKWIVFRQPNRRIAAFDDTYIRVYQLNEKNEIASLVSEATHNLGYCPARFFWSTQLNEKNKDLKKKRVMMKNQEKYAVAVRKPDHEIEVKVSEYTGIIRNKKIRNMPILRGVFSFIESLVLGMQTLTYSASFFEEEEEDKKKKEPMTEEERRRQEQKEKKQENAMMGGTVVLSIVLAVAVFMMLPYYLSTLFQKVITSQWLIALTEGVIRLVIFIGYVALISLMKDIRRVYMYHGAEHKCINCIEHGMDLTVENVRKSSRFHKRCGTSFLLIVMLVSILFFMFIRVDSPILRVVLRLLLIPVIAGVSYEFIRLAGRSDNAVVNLLSKPGLWLQGLTTKEPDDEMIEVGIASVEAVFDWKPYVEEIRREMK